MPSIAALLVTVVILAAIAAGGIYLISGVENYLKMHRFIRNIFVNIYVAFKYTFCGFIETAAAYGLYLTVQLIASQSAISSADPVLIAEGIGAMIVCFVLGMGTNRAVKRYQEIREKAQIKAVSEVVGEPSL